MRMVDVGKVISRAIKEQKWIKIKYKNKDNIETYYWIYIKDIDPEKKKLKVDMFNDAKSFDVYKNASIFFENILDAEILDLTCGDNNSWLIKKIETNILKFPFLKYDSYSKNLLYYLKECNEKDNDPSIKSLAMIPGVDLEKLLKEKKVVLDEEQEKKILEFVKQSVFDSYNNDIEFCLSAISIDKNQQSYVVCYYEVFFNPEKKTLSINKNLRFNYSFLIKGAKASLYEYLDMELDSFIDLVNKDFKGAVEYLRKNVKKGEVVSTRPSFYLQSRKCALHLDLLFDVIEQDYREGTLKPALKSFFGLMSASNYRRVIEPAICLTDSYVNIDQMRVLYNSLKYPVTFVQGPPGTGKTKTIINVIFSLLLNGKTCLICSSNNKPVDGILSKLSFYYENKKYKLPFLRLGNMEDTLKGIRKIKLIFDEIDNNPSKYNKSDIKSLIEENKKNSIQRNALLLKKIKEHERKIELEDLCKNIDNLLIELSKDNFSYKKLAKEKDKFYEEMNSLKEMSNQEIVKMFSPIESSVQLQKYFFNFKNNCFAILKDESYEELRYIVNIKDDAEAVFRFNKYLQNDKNLKLLLKVFPIILDTNMSSARLGSGKSKFDLVIMDESGQCNITHALIPIARAINLLLVGDPNQLKPIVLLDSQVNEELKEKYQVNDSYDYCKSSILECMENNDCISKRILLRYHYRCGKNIIRFSNERYYSSMLLTDFVKQNGELVYIDSKNNNVLERNSAYEEAAGIIKYIKRNNLDDVMIITPFRNQKDLIERLLKDEKLDDKISVGTIHALQGSEKSTIIFSTAISPKTSQKTYDWLKNNCELINVGITRAINKLVIACDDEAINRLSDKTDDLYFLMNYIKKNGDSSFKIPASPYITFGKSNNSQFEKEFFKTISQFCSVYKNFKAVRNVAFSKIFADDPVLSLSQQEFDCVLYGKHFLKTYPIIAFEINGGEHFGNAKRERADKRKIEVCQQRKIKLIAIPNSFAKAYEEIKDVIIKIAKNSKDVEQMSLFD